MADTETDFFKGHISRPTSKADVFGASVSDIMKQSHWPQTSALQKYCKNIFQTQVPIFTQPFWITSFQERQRQQKPLVLSEVKFGII